MASTFITIDVFQPGDLSINASEVKVSIDSLTVYLYIVTPSQPGTYPVIQFHHGFAFKPSSYSQLLHHISSHGFIVVAPRIQNIVLSGTRQIQNLAAVMNWLPDGLQPKLPAKVHADLSKLGLAGHSKGGKAAFCLALGAANITLNLKISALIGIDPVSGFNTVLRTDPKILTYIPRAFDLGIPVGVIGTGLGNVKKPWSILACAPNGVNHAEFFDECKPPCCYFLAKDYGHTDMLDDKMAALGGCLCKAGRDPKELMRRATGGIVVAFMKAYLEGQDDDFLAIVNQPKLAPIKLDPVIYLPY